jgi:hypothetical protein
VNFRIRGLSPEPFRHLYGLSEQQLGAHAALRYVADRDGGFPDRIELRDSRAGESFLLVNFVHQPAANPYRASHAVFVREGAEHPYDRIDEVPESMRTRLLSLRAFSADDLIVDADVVEGQRAGELIARLFSNPTTAYIHAHYARHGCFAARIDRA